MNQYFNKLLSLLCLVFLLTVACEKEYETIEELDEKTISDYLKKNNLNFQEHGNTGIYYQILSAGTGADLEYSDKIFATYTVKSLDGKFAFTADSVQRFSNFVGYFSSDYGFPNAFSGAVKEILKKKGGSIRLIIPSNQAFGRRGNSNMGIPGNASLDCTINVYSANNQTDFEEVFVMRYFTGSKINIDNFKRTSSGLYYQIITPGTGAVPNEASTVTVAYVGKLTNGTVFDQSTSFKSPLFQLISGWKEGLPEIREGGKIRLIIPPALAYASATSNVPPFATLDFVIDLTKVE